MACKPISQAPKVIQNASLYCLVSDPQNHCPCSKSDLVILRYPRPYSWATQYVLPKTQDGTVAVVYCESSISFDGVVNYDLPTYYVTASDMETTRESLSRAILPFFAAV